MISPFNTDTIQFNYSTSLGYFSSFGYPQYIWKNSSGAFSNPSAPDGTNQFIVKEIQDIQFPDHTRVNFVYGWTQKNTTNTRSISKIKISDSIFRFGYLLTYDTSYTAINTIWPYKTGIQDCKLLLTGLTPFTSAEKQTGYRFHYHRPYLPPQGNVNDTVRNKRDHWGFFNAAFNAQKVIPNVAGYTNGADREANSNAVANSLSGIGLPQGGSIWYNYQLNDRYPYETQQEGFGILNPSANTQNSITINQVFNSKHQIYFELDLLTRQGNPPITGSGILNCTIKSTNGSVTYASYALSLNELYYKGLQLWEFNLQNGDYILETQLSSGTSIGTGYPITVRWENKIEGSGNGITAGGLRVSSIGKTLGDEWDDPIVEIQKFNYVLDNGKSSGFLGDKPTYDYKFRKFDNGIVEDLTYILSDPVSPTESIQGSIVGYSRVEVLKSFNGELGKTVYEFTGLGDVNANYHAPHFPYTQQDIRNWGLGLPKRISVYDSAGVLLKRTVNQYSLDTVIYNSSNFKGLKLGHFADLISTGQPTVKIYFGLEYYPTGGKSLLAASYDTVYHSNGSMNASQQQYYYDTVYNLVKTVTSYDRNRGLNLETRNYYPYHYAVGGAIGKLRDSGLLTIAIASEKWITGDNNPRMISGSISTYKELSNGMIKPDTLFVLESNKPVAEGTIGIFASEVLNRNYPYFKPQTQYVSYNNKGIPLEIKDLTTEKSSSVIMDYNNQYPVAKVSNAMTGDVAYSSFESDGNGYWTIGSSSRDLVNSITGKKSYNLSNGNISKSSLNSSIAYLVSLWAKSGASVSVNGASLNDPIATHQGWNLYHANVNGVTSVTISGSGLVDELRLHPTHANMETQTYEPMIGVTSTTDPNNGIIYNEYDGLNRLKLLRDMDRNIIKVLQYSDTIMLISTLPEWLGIGSQCSPSVTAGLDTIYKDMNVFSDSSSYHKAVFKRLECSCAPSNPQYKVIEGVCEEGTWAVASSVYMKVEIEGTLQWRWVCTYRYCFSDGSQSTYYNEGYYLSPCSINCGAEW